MDMGNKIKEIRNEHGMNQEQLANKLHVTRQTVSNWENNKNYPDFTTLVKISELFDVSLDVLIKDDNEYIKKQGIVERKFVTRKRWIIILSVVAILLGGLCVFIYSLGQGTDNAKRVTTSTNVMMTVNLYDASLSRAITKTFDAKEFNNMSDAQQKKILKDVCGKIEGDIPAVHLGPNTSQISFDFRTTDYYDIAPHITDIELYTTNGMPPNLQKRTDRKVRYDYENGVVTIDVIDFVKSEELTFGDTMISVPEDEQISECVFLVRYEWGGSEYVSATAVSVLSNTDWSETSVEIDYEDKAFGSEKYTYNLSEQDRSAPAVFILGPDVKNRSFNVDIDEL